MSHIKKFLIFVFFIILIFSFSFLKNFYFSKSGGFTTLDQIMEYARLNPESPAPDDKDTMNVNFQSFYENENRIDKRYLKKFFEFLGFKNKPVWTPDDFKTLLFDTVKGLAEKRNTILKIEPQAGTKFYVFGDIQAAFHSLARDLGQLKKLHVIDNSLKIKNPNAYIVFLGNVPNLAPYSLETLTVVMQLMQNNPGKVVYLRGKHESQKYWTNFNITTQLRFYFSNLLKEKTFWGIPLEEELNKLFANLPLAIYVKILQDNKSSFIRISNMGKDDLDLDESEFSTFLLQKGDNNLEEFNLENKTKNGPWIDIAVLIEAENRMYTFRHTSGLSPRVPVNGATTWSVSSCPIDVSQRFFDFYFDAFSEIEFGKDLYNSKITLYNRDIREKGDEFKAESSYLISGHPASQPPVNGKIVIGSTMDFDAGVQDQTMGVSKGLFLVINQINRQGGLKGKYIKMVLLNDQELPLKAKKNVENLIKNYKTDILIGPTATPTLEAYLDKVEKKEVLVLFPITGTISFRTNKYPYIIHFRDSYTNEAKALMEYAYKVLDAKKYAFFHESGAFGLNAFKGAEEVLNKYKITNYVKAAYVRNTTNFSDAIKKITDFSPDTIILLSSGIATSGFIQQIGVNHLVQKVILGLSDSDQEYIKDYVNRKGINFVVAKIMPSFNNLKLPIVKEFRDLADANDFALDNFLLEGFIGGSIMLDAFKQIDGEITKEKVYSVISNFKNYYLKGLILTYNPQTNELTKDNVWLEEMMQK
ncbi:TPA: hypothetical protein DEO28_03705 [Candidatus Dependentiae bacterium]|nr:MAG: hypothetical protein UR14_C0007G0042 [candidate division TM6 bacterium GW2011_GWE2_31_21]KKP53597.1 MAG: hypothetical protein UR43_C0004G0138 [candidate division TM6 bacterium GW2011_GWF2_33_332]HBS48163.1 hypothetical protein [Candidatus Dependentiae bacterium]HBZ73587.1 hypothetical protein [Candidatus Dependentiae bacterium]